MADRIICPVCGESNPADMEFCRNCQSRLRPVGDENEAIQPGQLPTKKATSELEPLLPQWLREARQKARDSESQREVSDQAPPEPTEPPAPDLLAGLASQSSDEEEEIPDWLAQITGAETKKKKAAPEDNQVKWVELGRGNEQEELPPEMTSQTGKAEPEADPLGDWFHQAAASSETADFRMPPATPEEPLPPSGPPRPSEAEDLGWLKRLDAAVTPPAERPSAFTPAAPDETPDWLVKLQAEQPPTEAPETAAPAAPSQSPLPDWLKSFGGEAASNEATPAGIPETPAAEEPLFEPELPDWLKSAEPRATAAAQAEPVHEETSAPVELPDWLSALGSGQPEPPAQEPAKQGPSAAPAELPDWISALEGAEAQPPAEEPAAPASPLGEPAETARLTELPDWLAALGSSQPQAPAEEPSSPAFSVPYTEEPTVPPTAESPVETPDWLASLRAEQEPPKEEANPFASEVETPASAPAPQMPAEEPDWLSSLRAQEAAPAEQQAPTFPLAAEVEQSAEEGSEPIESAAQEELSGEDADAIFASMQAPDWLSAVLPPSSPGDENVPAASIEEEPIGPVELPSWVQAMRPVESAMEAAPSTTEEAPTEAQGPLAGLRGVLPVIPGAAVPSSKPRAHSIKLDATEQQQAHAALLEQILAAETSPVPMRSTDKVLRSQTVLRWVLSVLLIAVLGGALFSRSQTFQLPSGVPNETVAALHSVETIPDGAPVLLVFDYQPATIGEMEATGAALIDHLLLLKHPNIALLSTSPTGPALAEHFMSSTLADRAYARGTQYVNLGFLPGGLAGVYNFAQNPSATVPLDAASKPVWQSAVLARVQRFSDFAAIIVLTDSMESGRTWVEQTQGTRGNSLLVFVSSAQAGPMLLPYVDSGQVNGMVSGIYGAAGAEQRNAGSPAIYGLPGAGLAAGQVAGYVRRYWDAYSLGLYLAVIAIVIGAIANLWLGFRDRRANAAG